MMATTALVPEGSSRNLRYSCFFVRFGLGCVYVFGCQSLRRKGWL